MGRKREKDLIPGSKTTLYIPKDVDKEILSWMNDQSNLSPEIFNAIEFYIKYKDEIDDTNLNNIDIKKLISEEIAKQLKGIDLKKEVTVEPKLTKKQRMLRDKL